MTNKIKKKNDKDKSKSRMKNKNLNKKKKKKSALSAINPYVFRTAHDTFYEKANLRRTMGEIRELNKMTNLRIKKNIIDQKINKLKNIYANNEKATSQIELLDQMGQRAIDNKMGRLEKDMNWKAYQLNKRRVNLSSYSNLGF